jgi:hypothetical protein
MSEPRRFWLLYAGLVVIFVFLFALWFFFLERSAILLAIILVTEAAIFGLVVWSVRRQNKRQQQPRKASIWEVLIIISALLAVGTNVENFRQYGDIWALANAVLLAGCTIYLVIITLKSYARSNQPSNGGQ